MREIKRILLCIHREADYLGSMTALGAAEVLGSENVVCYPDKVSFRGQVDTYTSWWYSGEQGTTAPFPYLAEGIPNLAPTPTLEDLSLMLRTGMFDAVILESWRAEVQKAWAQIEDDVREAGIPIIAICGEDHSNLDASLLQTVRPHLYCKRELRTDTATPSVIGYQDGGACQVIPLPFSIPTSVLDFAEKVRRENPVPKYSVAFMVGRSHPAREEIYNALLSGLPADILARAYIGISEPPEKPLSETGVHPLLPFWEYIEVLSQSICTVVPRGHGMDTCRLWESYASSGVIMDNIPLVIPDDPRDIGAVSYDTPEECVQHVVMANTIPVVNGEPLKFWQALRQRGLAHAREKHSNVARFRHLLANVYALEGVGDE